MNQSRSSSNEGLFTFKPKLSLTSTRIVENMGTDFMARQQNHLEKQKKMLEKVEHPRNGQLSPMGKTRKSNKEWTKDGSYADQDVQNDTKSKIHETSSDEQLTKPTKEKISANLQRILDGPYASGHPDMALKKLRPPGTSQRPRYPQSRPHSDGDDSDDDRKDNQPTSQSCVEPGMLGNMRSKTMPPQQTLNRPKLGGRRSSYMTGDRLRMAKDLVDKAIRLRKVFTIQGGYSAVRNSLRRRGWIEKFYRLTVPVKKPPGHKRKRNSEEDEDDDADDDDDGDCTDDDDGHKPEEPKIPPWEEEEGIYGIMSRMVRNVNPSFYWVLKRDAIDYRFLGREQMVNHYCKAGSFTTKVGLCVNMRNVPWYEQANPDVFFPRCYRLSHNEDKEAFIDDFRLTSCINIIKLVLKQAKDGPELEKEEVAKPTDSEDGAPPAPQKCDNPECAKLSEEGGTDTVCEHMKAVEDAPLTPKSSKAKTEEKKKKKKSVIVPLKALENSISECEQFLRSKNHDDIDDRDSTKELSPHNWNQLIQWFYMLAHEGGVIPNVPLEMIRQCESLLNRLKTHCPQLEMDGAKNVWIVKPGAKSRGRGIVCYAKLEEMLKLVDSHVMKKEGKFVVQKYIERPLLIYNTKFDIRQWFLVTDWNPLTLWFYQDCYLRFCSQEYTLDKFDESIHLSNNAIQKNYKNGPRSTMLPQENMWSHYEFKEFLNKRRQGHKWEELIYPGMKKAIICALLATQDLVEYRKFSFELYGADFMLTEDYKPWLIEINCSPSMEASTAITAELCTNVLEDTVKVVVDRRFDKNADSGRFELAYKQSPVTVPPYIGLNLSVDGQGIKPPPAVKSTESSCSRLHESASQEEKVDTDKVTKASDRDEAKSDEEGETTDMPEQKTSNPPSKSSSATRDLHKRKSQSSPFKTASKMSQESIQSTQKSAGTTKSEATWKKERAVSQSVISQTNGVSKSLASPTSMYTITGGRRIVSRTSVANNYPVVNTNQGQKEQQTLQVNTVDSKTLQSQSSTSAPIKGRRRRKKHSVKVIGTKTSCGALVKLPIIKVQVL
ncbi:tubulin tyrosine ligase 3-like isoform X2 [Liolophura sinensis]|uniref:tubulin tyrosine ligase 3-like isoform X2 n=1 Tax=Liolophura sinensis TaxID=3198878 RepID=UPI003158F2A4